jgi:putative ABC transport system permease protein
MKQKENTANRPPVLAEWIVQRLTWSEDQIFIKEDLREEYQDFASMQGLQKARFWYWKHVFRSIIPFIKNSFYWRVVMFRNYFKVALRNIQRHKAFSFINITGLAIGMACCILIMLWVQDELSFDKFHESRDTLYRLIIQSPDATGDLGGSTIPYALAPILKSEYPEIANFTRYQDLSWLLNSSFTYKEKKFYEPNFFLADPTFFEMFSFSFIKGDPATALQDIYSIVLTEDTANKYFGTEDPVGKVLRINNVADLKVTGVVQNLPHNTHMQFDLISPIQILGEEKIKSWAWESYSYIQLQPNTNAEEFREKIAGALTKHSPQTWIKSKVNFQPVKKIHLHQGRGDIRLVYIFSSVAFFILLIACINFMNLSTARSAKRAKEVGLRKIVGAHKPQLIRQFFNESLLLAFIALVMALILVRVVLGAFNNLTSKPLALDIIANPALFVGLVVLTILVGIIAGSYPALFLSAFQPVRVLKSGFSGRSGGSLFRKILVIFQFSISVVLIIGSIIVFQQLYYIQNRDLGWDRENIIAMPINNELKQQFRSLKTELEGNPNILSVTAASSIPTHIGNTNPILWEGKETSEPASIKFVVTEHDYVKTFDMEILQGRDFSRDYETDMNNFIINQEAVELMKLESPLGKQIQFMGVTGEIIGVVKDFHFRHVKYEIIPLILTIHPRNYDYFHKFVFVKLRPTEIPQSIEYVRTVCAKYSPHFPFKYRFVDDDYNNMYIYERYVARISNTFTFLAIFIACLGLFGLASFMAEQRTKEIGVRKVLGASVPGIIVLLTKEFSKWVIIANVIAWPIAYFAMSKWLNNYSYRVPIFWWIFIVAGVAALAIASLTVSYQAVKAARANPVDSLRYE